MMSSARTWPRCTARRGWNRPSTITDRVLDGMMEWQSRPLDPVLFIDAIVRREALCDRVETAEVEPSTQAKRT